MKDKEIELKYDEYNKSMGFEEFKKIINETERKAKINILRKLIRGSDSEICSIHVFYIIKIIEKLKKEK